MKSIVFAILLLAIFATALSAPQFGFGHQGFGGGGGFSGSNAAASAQSQSFNAGG